MDVSFLQSQIDDLNKYLKGEVHDDTVISSLDTLLNWIARENDEKKIEIFLTVVFNKTNGLLQFLRELKKSSDISRDIVEKLFECLKNLMSDFKNVTSSYISEIFDICKTNLSWAQSSSMKLKSYEFLIFIVKSTNSNEFFLENPQVLSNFLADIISKTESTKSHTELRNIYVLIGAIIDSYREIVTDTNKTRIFRKLRNELTSQLDKDNIVVLEGCYECLLGFLKQFAEEQLPSENETVYVLVRRGCESNKRRKTSIRAALRIIGQCFPLFGDHVYNDYIFWYSILSDYLSSANKEDYIVALEVLDVFYSNMEKILRGKEDAQSKNVLKFLLGKLESDLSSSETHRITSAIKNFGHFATTCRKFGTDKEVENMFHLMAEIADKYCSGFGEENMELFHLSDLLVSITAIINSESAKVNDFDENKLNILVRITVHVIVSYPKVDSSHRQNVRRSIVETVICLALFNVTLFDSYLEKFMYLSLIRSCSVLMELDAELVKDNRDFQGVVSAVDYNPVWTDLCNITEVTYLKPELDNRKPEIQRRGLHSKIFDKFVLAVLKIIDKLDFSLIEDDSPDPSNCVISIERGATPRMESDYYIFANLVQLFSHVISTIDFDVFNPWIPKLTSTFIDLAMKCPIKNGFFELLSVVLKKCKIENQYNEETRNLNLFLREILCQIPEFKGRDLISCLHILMNVPQSSIENILPYMITLFQNVFTLGLENISLAREGLNTLNEWYLTLPPGQFDTILPALMPHLHLYLDSKEFKGDTDAMTKYEEKLLMPVIRQRKNKLHRKFHRVFVDTTNTEQYMLRRDIIRFLSKVEIELCSSVYSVKNFTIREMTDVLKFDLPYVDMKVRIYLDKCLPRIVELARNSSDTKTRIVAGELLHSVTTIFIGNTAQDFQSAHPKGAETLSKNLLVSVFKLGSDMNGVISQLYRPLCFQLTHYYSSKVFENRSFVTNVFLDILFDGISNDDDTLYRQFSGELIQEFVDWSIKHSKNDHSGTRTNSNVIAVIKRIYLFCMLPCSRKRLGAATAFNNIYHKLREELIILQNYWIEILYHFVRSLNSSADDDCNNKQTSIALDHLKRVLYERFDLFTEKSCRRQLPKEIEGGTLLDVVNWLLTYCTSPNRYCRVKCISLVEDLTSRLEYGSFENYFNVVGCYKANEVLGLSFQDFEVETCLKNSLDYEGLCRIINWMKRSLSRFHCVNWLVTRKVMNVDNLFLHEPNLIGSMKFFVKNIMPLTKHNFQSLTANTRENFPNMTASFELLQQEIFLLVLNILSNCSKDNFALFATEEILWDKFVSLLFESSQFSVVVLTNEKWNRITTLILEYINTLPELISNPIFTQIDDFPYKNTFWGCLNDISGMSFPRSQDQQYLDGLKIMQATNVLSKINTDIELQKREIIKRIFASSRRNNAAFFFNSKILTFLEDVMGFCLKNAEITFIIELIFNPTELRDERKNTPVLYGRHFFCIFKNPIIEYLNDHQSYLISYCLQEPASITTIKIRTLVDCVVSVYDSKGMKFEEVMYAVYANWKTLVFWSQRIEARDSLLFELIEKTIDYYRRLEKYDRSVITLVFQWLLDQLTCVENSVMTKKRFVGLLSSFLSEKLTENEDQMLRTSLNSLQQQYFSSVETMVGDNQWNVILFDDLLHSLARSRCMCLLEFVIRIRCLRKSANSSDNRIQEVLEKLCVIPSEEQSTLLLFIYDICQQESQSIEFRVNCIQVFFTPLLYATSKDAVIRFFHSKLAQIWNTFRIPLRIESNNVEKTSLNNLTVAVLLIDAYSEVIPDFDSPELTKIIFTNDESCIRKEFFKRLRDIVVQKVNVMNHDYVPCVRKLQCYAYNALIKVIRRVHREEKFYKLLFMESPKRDMFVWSRIVDCNVRIKLEMVSDQVSAGKKKVAHRKRKIRSSRTTHVHLSIPTQYLATSSLVDDVVRHDMSEWNIGTGSQQNGHPVLDDYSIELEEDKLNNHECMASLCELINFIFKTRVSPEPKVEEGIIPAIPEWMECIRESFKWYLRRPDQKNIILFILKLIFNCDKFFRPYACHWVDLIIDSLCVLQDFNYFVMEIIIMLLDWNAISAPKNQDSKSRLLNFVVKKMEEQDYVTMIQNYLFELIDVMIMTWHGGLHAPTFCAVYSSGVSACSEKKLELGLRLCKRFLLSDAIPFDEASKTRFISSLLHPSLMSKLQKSNKFLMFEVTGLILRILKNKPDVLSIEEHSSLQKRLFDCLNNMNVANVKTKTDLFFSCLLRTVSYYPDILQIFAPNLLRSFGKFQGEMKTKCLKILSADVSQLPDDAFTLLMQQNFVYCIRGSDDNKLRNIALKTIKLCLEKITEKDLQQLMPDIWRLSTKMESECRSYVYDIADYIYEQNKNKTDDEHDEMKVKCKTILLNGLLDNDSALQQKLFSTWEKRLNLENKVSIRFEQILKEMYSPLNESQFVCNAVDFLLDGSRSTPDYESKIFDNPLFGGCQFQNYEVNLSYRSVASHTPLFGSSFTNKFLTLSQNSDFDSPSLYLRRTQDNLMFQPTLNSQVETDTEVDVTTWPSQAKTEYQTSAIISETSPAIKKLKRPLHESSAEASSYFASLNVKKRDKRNDLLKLKTNDRKVTNLCRRYRYGDIPDIEIPRSALIEPLKALAKRDPIIGKLVFTSILDGILRNVDRKNYLNLLNNNFKELLMKSSLRDTIFVETLFEIAFNYPEDIHFDTQHVMTASYASGLHSFGALLLEESISLSQNVECVEQPSKKRRTNNEGDKWTQLAELYKALDQTDIVNGILKEKLTDTECSELKQGLEFEQTGNWIDALKVYSALLDETSKRPGEFQNERFVLEAYSNCAAYLSQWNELNCQITKKFRDVNALWNDNWNVETTLPWFLTSEAYTCMYETRILGSHDHRNVSSAYMETIYAWLENEENKLILMNLVPESLTSLLVLAGKQTEALVFINECIKLILDDWHHWKSTEDKFSKVQILSEFEALLVKPTNEMEVTMADKINEVIEIWRRNTRNSNNSVCWDRKVVQKLFFKRNYSLLLSENEDDSYETLQRLDLFEIETILSFIENALDSKNIAAVCNYFRLYEKIGNNRIKETEDIVLRYRLDLSKMFLLQGINNSPQDRKTDFQKCLEELLEDREKIIESYPYEYHTHVANISSVIMKNEELVTSDRPYWINLASLIRTIVFRSTNISADDVVFELRNAILSNYEKAAIVGVSHKTNEDVSKACLKAAQFCRLFIDDDKENEACQSCLIRVIFKAMKFDSKEGQILFPTLLQLSLITSNNLKNEFLDQSANIEEWKFLPWISQLLAYANVENMLPVIEDIIVRTIKKYPSVVYFSYLLYKEKFNSNLCVESFAKKLENILDTNPENVEISKLVKELSFVRTPVSYFVQCWQELKKTPGDKLCEVARKIDAEITHELPAKGKLFQNDVLLNALKSCLNSVKNEQDSQKAVDSFGEAIKRQRNTGHKMQTEWLKNFNPWLVDSFIDQCSFGVELPGQYSQYNGCTCPDPERHVKIYEFEKKVEVQNSKQQPIKIDIIGTDGNRYSYLIKFEEDMQQDQRIQQIFVILNRCSRDASSIKDRRKLSTTTYNVFPLNKNFGMIEWVNNTTTLKDFLDISCSDEEKISNNRYRETLQNEYVVDLHKKYHPTGNLSNYVRIYEEAVKRIDEIAVTASFRTLSGRIPENVFRKSLVSLCHSSNEFWQLRNQFISSYSTMCIYGWILGIGDRHLKNTLVCLKTGNCIGIDFGVAFGTGIESLPIPELIPFRMTPHIKAIMAPFYLTGLIRETMINILRIIHKNEYILLATLQIFILDPSSNWINTARNRMPHLRQEVDVTNNEADTQFCPKQIAIVQRKLRGGHPAQLMIEEIWNNNFISDEHRNACIRLLERVCTRISLPADHLTAVQQATCLLELATDECILGTSWHGLETYI